MHQLTLAQKIEKYEQNWFFRLEPGTRRRLHALLLPFIRMRMRLSGWSIRLTGKADVSGLHRPVIIAANHIGKMDLEMVSVTTGLHFCTLTSDFDAITKHAVDSFFLGLNGVLYFDAFNRADSTRVKREVIETLNRGINILWCPEGEWNFSPNVLVQPLYFGMAEVVYHTDALVIPVGLQVFDKTYHVNIGAAFDLKQYLSTEDPLSKQSKQQAINHLRDVMASLIWEILETQPIYRRDNIHPQTHQRYIEKRLSEWPGSSQQATESKYLMNRVR